MAYLEREKLPVLRNADRPYATVGPLHAEQAIKFEMHWRPFVA
jgi:hypothetical protein